MATEGNARRLPSWMVGGVAAADDKASDKEEKKSKGQVEVDAVGSGSRRRTRGTKLRYRSGDDGIDDQFDNEAGIGVRTKKKGKRESAKVVVDGPVSGDCTGEEEEEDVELTAEDLVSIAEEYVKADKDAKKEQLLEKEHESWRRLPMAHSSQNVSEASFVIPDIEQKPEDSFRATENPSSKQTLLSATVSTGDPARDMLDLFLGPLLKKPVDDQKNTDFCANNLDFAFELVRRSQNNVGEDIVAQMKKKGSFKDKVSSLLD